MAVLSNVRHERFCLLTVEGRNGPDAYMAAGFAVTDRRVAAANAARLLARDDIKERIAELQVAHAERHKATVDNLVAELTQVAFANAGEYFDWGPDGVRVKDKESLSLAQQSVVAEVSQTITEGGGTIRVKLHSKLDAIEKLGRHLGIFEKDNRQQGKAAGEAMAAAANASSRDLARAVLDILRTAQVEGAAGERVDDDPDDEPTESEPEDEAPPAPVMPVVSAGKPVDSPAPEPPRPRPITLQPGEIEVLDANQAQISLSQEFGGRYAVHDWANRLCGFRHKLDDARVLAAAVKPPPPEEKHNGRQ